MELSELISIMQGGGDLTQDQASIAGTLMASAEIRASDKTEFLTSLAQKGETGDEVAGFASCFRELARDPGLSEWQDSAIDVCGTGGDKQHTFNISTTVTFMMAAAGIPVFKHGNKSITSKCGSANLLEALGVNLMADDETLRASMKELGFCFMFAPAFHPAFKEIMPVRQELAQKGQRTIFNMLGPLINPAKPSHQLLGVFSGSVVEIMASAQHAIGLKRGLVAHCLLGDLGGMDEFSVAGENVGRGFGELVDFDQTFSAEDCGLSSGSLDDLKGGELEENLEILNTLLDGKAPKALEDSVVLNGAAGLFAAGRCDSIGEGVPESRDLLLGGATRSKIDHTKEFYNSL